MLIECSFNNNLGDFRQTPFSQQALCVGGFSSYFRRCLYLLHSATSITVENVHPAPP